MSFQDVHHIIFKAFVCWVQGGGQEPGGGPVLLYQVPSNCPNDLAQVLLCDIVLIFWNFDFIPGLLRQALDDCPVFLVLF